MVKVKPGNLTERAVPRSRGNYLTNVGPNTFHVQKWPKKRGKAKQGGAFYQQWEFGIAAAWASDPEPINYQSSIELAKGSDNVPRDILMMASFGTLYDIYLPDGTKAVSYRMVAPNAQLILDQVTDELGALLVRLPIGWFGISPGNNNWVLTMQDNVPTWAPATGGGGGAATVNVYDIPGAHVHALTGTETEILIAMVGGGGGGGSGRRTAVGVAASGGAGGGGAAYSTLALRAATLPAALALNVGAGGTGGAARTTDSTNGQAGSNGTDTTIAFNGITITAAGANGGAPGTTAVASGGAAGSQGTANGGAGGGVSAGGNGGNAPGIATLGAPGGGAGGGVPAAPANRNGGNGGAWTAATGWPIVGGAGGVASSSTPAGDGAGLGLNNVLGTGGGGGFATTAGIPGNGGNGGDYGAGGGGGGASLNGNDSGEGGDGGDGCIVIISW